MNGIKYYSVLEENVLEAIKDLILGQRYIVQCTNVFT